MSLTYNVIRAIRNKHVVQRVSATSATCIGGYVRCKTVPLQALRATRCTSSHLNNSIHASMPVKFYGLESKTLQINVVTSLARHTKCQSHVKVQQQLLLLPRLQMSQRRWSSKAWSNHRQVPHSYPHTPQVSPPDINQLCDPNLMLRMSNARRAVTSSTAGASMCVVSETAATATSELSASESDEEAFNLRAAQHGGRTAFDNINIEGLHTRQKSLPELPNRPPLVTRAHRSLWTRVHENASVKFFLRKFRIAHSAELQAQALAESIMDQSQVNQFFRQCGPISTCYHSTFMLMTLHMWLLQQRMFSEGPKGIELWERVQNQLFDESNSWLASQVGREGEHFSFIAKSLRDTHCAVLDEINAACLQLVNSTSSHCDQTGFAIREVLWERLYARNERMNAWHLDQLAMYMFEQLSMLRDTSWKKITRGNIRWGLPIEDMSVGVTE
jgi:hypothetical protein